ncbi:SDR family NAD(P)-dependent oxidoreductase [Paraburkholderia caballeronis]|uniref:SDR family NAD(P)-dependent oxidoreductase n=1 Tax=Paraburkholderia caballeronis TaxID=416943 RepID=UPI001065F30C|nr:SDR family NAD(P)-dependent oxidoreductase [Paraburkholderia caballeronis]TDV20932.1 L-rhamnose 1-dehydrogenase [Paraburkholderia caballeronis]TDV21361.1 L-rhamnose 1-dehydrogenase [Paraburkholderia caballeronis]TDV33400.1 L-rhamnose 1-dehydrogenase [Paraburkholderia caballeronis]
MLLNDKVVIVTGGSRGIGRAIALACAREGAHVAINYWGDNDASYGRRAAIAEVLDEIGRLGRRAIAIEGNVAAPQTGIDLVRQTVERFGKVDVLASNAGICPFHSFLDMPPAVLERTIGVNLNGAFYVTQAVARQMKEQGSGGAIVATSSISALVGGGMQTHYTPTKAGVHSLMQSCAIALGPYGIRCNSVMPGTIATDLNAEDLADETKRRYFEQRIPLGRLGQPDDVAECVVFLASDRARYVTGAALLVDGGLFVNLQ